MWATLPAREGLTARIVEMNVESNAATHSLWAVSRSEERRVGKEC